LGCELRDKDKIELMNVGTTSTDRKWQYSQDYNRTQQTAEAILEGNQAKNSKIRRYFNLGFYTQPYQGSDYFFAKYKRIVDVKRDEIMREMFPDKNFNELGPDQQERVMCLAEEPAIEWYLQHQNKHPEDTEDAKNWYNENRKSVIQKTITPRESAALAAYQLNRLLNSPQFMKNKTKKNYFSVGNQIASEPFLVYAALGKYPGVEHGNKTEDDPNFNAVQKLREIGGSLKILEGWCLQIKTNDDGKLIVKLKFRDKEFDLDLNKVRELAEIGRKLHELKDKKIDIQYINEVSS